MTTEWSPPHTERGPGYRTQTHRLRQLSNILFECYQTIGPAHLLDVVVELSWTVLKQAVICDVSLVAAATGHVGDVLYAVFLLNYDLEALHRAILCYQSLLEGESSSSSTQRSYWTAKLARARFRRSRALSDPDDCRAALDLIESQAAADNGDNHHAHAWILIASCDVKANNHLPWTLAATISRDDLTRLLTDVREIQSMRLSQSVRIEALIEELYLEYFIITKTQQLQNFQSLSYAVHLVLRRCPEGAEVLRSKALLLASSLHFIAQSYAQDDDEAILRLKQAIVFAEEALSLTNLMTRNKLLHWVLLRALARPKLALTIKYQDLDAREHVLELLKDLVLTTPSQSSVYYADAITDYIWAMGVYFEQSGRVGVFDHLFPILLTCDDALMASTIFLASNAAEAMLARAQVADANFAKSLVDSAIHICQVRMASLSSSVHENHENDAREKDALNLQLIAATRMQMRWGQTILMSSIKTLEVIQAMKANIPPQEVSARAAMVVAHTDALIFRSLTDKNQYSLTVGLHLIDHELASPEMSGSIYMTDLLAARGDVLFAQLNFEKTGAARSKPLQLVWDQYRTAATATAERPRERFQTCLRWASRAAEHGYTNEAYEAYNTAIEILPQVIFRGEEVLGRIEALRQVSGLAASSFATALALRDIPAAIDFLEKARGILWLQSLRVRDTQLSLLPTSLRDQFVRIDDELRSTTRLNWTTRRHKADEMASMIAEIRLLPSYERFQLPPLMSDIYLGLRQRGSYLIVIVPGISHSDVIILGMEARDNSGAHHLRLPAMTDGLIRGQSQEWDARCSNARAANAARDSDDLSRGISKSMPASAHAHDPLLPLLSELWTTLVHPIMKYLGIHPVPDPTSRKRVWWCPTGALSSLPLHAAGIYEGPMQDHVGRYAISSYTPTITALYRLLEETPAHSFASDTSKVLVVAQPTSIGHAPLLNVEREIDHVRNFVPLEMTEYLNAGQGASVSDAMESLKTAQVVHLACHGHQDQENPLNSGFELEDGRLTLELLMQVDTPQAQLAYLSACDSAGMDESRPDEGLNLVGTMIFVGFRSVIGTMWAMDDVDGPFMAGHIYSRVFKDGRLDLDAVPYAVDEAVRLLRESGVSACRWATYVHFGV